MNINNINVNKYPISQMLDPDSRVVFEIPRYQREYVWGTREWAALYDDLSDNCECQRKSEPSANQYLSHLCERILEPPTPKVTANT